MEQLRETHSVDTVLKALRFLALRLTSRAETATLAERVNSMRQAVADTDNVWQQAHDERCGATAEITYLDSVLDRAVSDLSREVLVLAKNNRSDPRYKKLFGVVPSAGMAGTATPEQERYVANIITRLVEDPDYTTLKARADTLTNANKALKAALAKRETFYGPETTAHANRRVALDNAVRMYNRMYAELSLVFDNDRALVDSYFPALSKRARQAPLSDDDNEDPS